MTENDEINETFTLTKQKNPGVYKQRSIGKWFYINTENEKLSLPCPADGCICGTFS